jgi:hypothetical protein
VRQINLRMSHATARLFIDGKLVHEGGTNHSLEHRFSRGFHLLEVDYAGGWHTTDFAVSLTEPHRLHSREDIAHRVSRLGLGDYDLYYFGTYDAEGGSIAVELPKSRRPALVWLDSYEPVTWSLTTPDRPVRAIVASHEPGATVTGLERDRVFLTSDYIGVDSANRSRCECIRGRLFHCETDASITEAADALAGLLGQTLAGFSVAHGPGAMAAQPYDMATRVRLERAEADVARREALCRPRRAARECLREVVC